MILIFLRETYYCQCMTCTTTWELTDDEALRGGWDAACEDGGVSFWDEQRGGGSVS